MSFTRNTGVRLFPTDWIKSCIAQYKKNHGNDPKILVLASDDLLDYKLSCSIIPAQELGLEEITHGDYLKVGEIDLAIGHKT